MKAYQRQQQPPNNNNLQVDNVQNATTQLIPFWQLDKVLKAKKQLLAFCQVDKYTNIQGFTPPPPQGMFIKAKGCFLAHCLLATGQSSKS